MTETQPTIRCTDRNDLLAVPTMLLGFHPAESLVMMRLAGKEVEFVSRVDARTLHHAPDMLMAQLLAVDEAPGHRGGSWMLLLYSHDPASFLEPLMDVAAGVESVANVFITDDVHSWEVSPDGPRDVQPHDPLGSRVAAEAVWRGQPWARTRDDVVAALLPWDPCSDWVDEARDLTWSLAPDDRLELLRSLVEAGVPQGKDRALVASLLGEEECFAEMLAQMGVASASARKDVLLAAREHAPPEAVANVTALLALACWLAGEGALTSDCLVELDRFDPTHPVGDMIRTMQRLAIPPSRWDEP